MKNYVSVAKCEIHGITYYFRLYIYIYYLIYGKMKRRIELCGNEDSLPYYYVVNSALQRILSMLLMIIDFFITHM